MGWHIYIPNIESLHHLEVCQYAAKCSKNAIFWTFLEFFKHGSLKNYSINAKFYMDLVEQVYCLQTKYPVSTSSRSLTICRKMEWKCGFFLLFWIFLNVAPTKMTALTRDFRWTYWSKCIVYIPNIKSVRHLEVCQYAAKCSENAVFFYFFGVL